MAAAATNAGGYGFKSIVAEPIGWLDEYGWDVEAETPGVPHSAWDALFPTTSRRLPAKRLLGSSRLLSDRASGLVVGGATSLTVGRAAGIGQFHLKAVGR